MITRRIETTKWITVLACVLVMGTSSTASANAADDASMAVFAEVVANMSVNPGAAFVDLSTVQVGSIVGYIPFLLEANTQTCLFYGAASRLYKGDDPVDPTVPPIQVLQAAGITFHVPDGVPTGGQDNNAEYIGDVTVNGSPGHYTEWIEIESSQDNRFSQMVTLEVTWIQDDPEKPMGEYSGYVEFFAMVRLIDSVTG